MNRFAKSIIAVSTVILVAIGTTLSAGATTISAPALSLHNAPAQNSAVSSTIAKGTKVNVGVCNSAWCYVTTANQKGWVETAKLSGQLSQANQNARSMSAGGGSGGSVSGSRTASASLNISITIVSKNDAAKLNNGNKIDVAKMNTKNLR